MSYTQNKTDKTTETHRASPEQAKYWDEKDVIKHLEDDEDFVYSPESGTDSIYMLYDSRDGYYIAYSNSAEKTMDMLTDLEERVCYDSEEFEDADVTWSIDKYPADDIYINRWNAICIKDFDPGFDDFDPERNIADVNVETKIYYEQPENEEDYSFDNPAIRKYINEVYKPEFLEDLKKEGAKYSRLKEHRSDYLSFGAEELQTFEPFEVENYKPKQAERMDFSKAFANIEQELEGAGEKMDREGKSKSKVNVKDRRSSHSGGNSGNSGR